MRDSRPSAPKAKSLSVKEKKPSNLTTHTERPSERERGIERQRPKENVARLRKSVTAGRELERGRR